MTIRLTYKRDSVALEVEDNGKGFKYSSETVGFGILGMQKRAHDVGAKFQIISTPGAGTLIRVTARLENATLIERIFMSVGRASNALF